MLALPPLCRRGETRVSDGDLCAAEAPTEAGAEKALKRVNEVSAVKRRGLYQERSDSKTTHYTLHTTN